MEATTFVTGTSGQQYAQRSGSAVKSACSVHTSDASLFPLAAAVSALAKFGAQNESLLPSILVLLQR